ncbi:MAG TPA: hypothetical protein VNA25_30490 [Phycisphaerae bacterium]|nr:hypothetical protein [Phycisphaerae bacterium]
MVLVKELFDWVAAQTGLERGVDWHCGYLPAKTSGAVAVLLEAGGDPMSPRLRHNLEMAVFQVLCLGPVEPDFWEAHDLGILIHRVLRDAASVRLGDGSYPAEWIADTILAQAKPQLIGGDERFRHEVSAMYVVRARSAELFAV